MTNSGDTDTRAIVARAYRSVPLIGQSHEAIDQMSREKRGSLAAAVGLAREESQGFLTFSAKRYQRFYPEGRFQKR